MIRETRAILAPTWCRKIYTRTKERISLSMPNQQLYSKRRTKQSCLASLVESLATCPGNV
jgi:hypothetical protein